VVWFDVSDIKFFLVELQALINVIHNLVDTLQLLRV
jgi:hypothetical protein